MVVAYMLYNALRYPLASRAAMATLPEILAELADVANLCASSRMAEAVKHSCITSLATKICAMRHMDAGVAFKLVSTLAAGDMPEDKKQIVQDAVDKRMLEASTLGTCFAKQKAECQVLTNWPEYLTANDWQALNSPDNGPNHMIGVIAMRGAKLGIRNYAEQSVKAAIAIVLAQFLKKNGGNFPSYLTMHGWVLDFKKTADSLQGPCAFSRMARYPFSPTDLPDAVARMAYDETDPPVQRVIDNLTSLSEHIPLRSTSRLLKRAGAATQGSADGTHPNMQQAVTWQDLLALRDNMTGNSGASGSGASPILTLFGNAAQPQPQFALPAPGPSDAPAAAAGAAIEAALAAPVGPQHVLQFALPAPRAEAAVPDAVPSAVPAPGLALLDAPGPLGDSEPFELAAFASFKARGEAAALKRPAAVKDQHDDKASEDNMPKREPKVLKRPPPSGDESEEDEESESEDDLPAPVAKPGAKMKGPIMKKPTAVVAHAATPAAVMKKPAAAVVKQSATPSGAKQSATPAGVKLPAGWQCTVRKLESGRMYPVYFHKSHQGGLLYSLAAVQKANKKMRK